MWLGMSGIWVMARRFSHCLGVLLSWMRMSLLLWMVMGSMTRLKLPRLQSLLLMGMRMLLLGRDFSVGVLRLECGGTAGGGGRCLRGVRLMGGEKGGFGVVG